MLGIDFPELVVIAVVALIVIGPEHLPKVARTMGHLWGRAQRYVNGVKADISRDMALEELRKVQQQAQQEAEKLENSIHQVTSNTASENESPKSENSQEPAAPRHQIIEEHHAVMPASVDQKKTTNT